MVKSPLEREDRPLTPGQGPVTSVRYYYQGEKKLIDHILQSEVVMTKANALFSTMVRAGRTTYFVDVKEAKNGNKYISISENKITGDQKKERVTVRVFGDSIEEFKQAINDAAAAVSQ
jgi:3-hydroxymyristoyl/3-hydroxydecanoyl-(acyl carrier protein) dehydratase